ncbi:hypothetical protein K469DRAFT_692182 [Zopfia rhizophila CBS 207.26]|uniref:Uncharacterized protein n=1 Tax=Zopfia rhizophila CBS 207.26 TaxID=1314779 RepID=A0A6A6DPB3_9PEZI|nr:hypothetical protein K469DRAFT_692182 [Zopfia rhizophila CBS 207.26]
MLSGLMSFMLVILSGQTATLPLVSPQGSSAEYMRGQFAPSVAKTRFGAMEKEVAWRACRNFTSSKDIQEVTIRRNQSRNLAIHVIAALLLAPKALLGGAGTVLELPRIASSVPAEDSQMIAVEKVIDGVVTMVNRFISNLVGKVEGGFKRVYNEQTHAFFKQMSKDTVALMFGKKDEAGQNLMD